MALLTIRSQDCVLALAAGTGDEVDSLIEDSAEESLADASGYERSAGFKTEPRADARGSKIMHGRCRLHRTWQAYAPTLSDASTDRYRFVVERNHLGFGTNATM